ncbi:MAG: sigma-70 family RNA polymerase sigma factor [bacterium]
MDASIFAKVEEEALVGTVARLAALAVRRQLLTDDVDDVVNDVVLEFMENLHGEAPTIPNALNAYVNLMVLRRLHNHMRATARREARETEHLREQTERARGWMSPALAMEEAEVEQMIEALVSSLSDRRRQVFTMVRREGASYETVAAALGITIAAVSQHMVRINQQFREALATYPIVLPARNSDRMERGSKRKNQDAVVMEGSAEPHDGIAA